MCSRVTTTDGRSPGSRVVAYQPPSQARGPSGIWRRLAAYSCGGSHGVEEYPRTVFPFDLPKENRRDHRNFIWNRLSTSERRAGSSSECILENGNNVQTRASERCATYSGGLAIRLNATLLTTPSSAQNSKLVSVTTTINRWESAAGTSLCDSGASGAPIRCGSAMMARPSTAAQAAGRKTSSQSPPAVAAAVAIHQVCRAVSGATGIPGNSGGRPRPGAAVNTTKPASPHSRPSRHAILAPLDRIDPGEKQGKADRGQDIGSNGEGVTLKTLLGLPFAFVAVGLVMVVGSTGLVRRGR